MSKDWEAPLNRWTAAGLVDESTAARVREFEAAHTPAQGFRWPVLVALAFGTVLLAAGALLFVSAHWDELSPAARMTLLVLMIAVFHAGGAAAGRFEGLSIALHTIGTIALGAGIALAGQIYHLSEHWPSAVLLWAVGSAVGWALLRQWPQAALTALLVPYWAASEWMFDRPVGRDVPVAAGLCGLAFTYLTARQKQHDMPTRRALGWIGGIALIPTAAFVSFDRFVGSGDKAFDWSAAWLPLLIASATPLALAYLLRGRAAIWNAAASVWVLLLTVLSVARYNIALYAWCMVGCLGLAFWGMREVRAERINLAFLGFAITVLAFYFSDVMAKLDRALSLILLGVIFLGGGWLLERTRRRIIARLQTEAQ